LSSKKRTRLQFIEGDIPKGEDPPLASNLFLAENGNQETISSRRKPQEAHLNILQNKHLDDLEVN